MVLKVKGVVKGFGEITPFIDADGNFETVNVAAKVVFFNLTAKEYSQLNLMAAKKDELNMQIERVQPDLPFGESYNDPEKEFGVEVDIELGPPKIGDETGKILDAAAKTPGSTDADKESKKMFADRKDGKIKMPGAKKEKKKAAPAKGKKEGPRGRKIR